MTIDTTLSGAKSNSYVSVAFADSYFTDHYDADKSTKWAALSTAKKTTLLIQATRILETMKCTNTTKSNLEYIPQYNKLTGKVEIVFEDRDNTVKYSYYQKLQFPRNIDVDQTTGLTFIPEEVMMAQCEQAIYLLDVDVEDITSSLNGAAFKATTVGQISLRTEFKTIGSLFAPLAYELLKPFNIKGVSKIRRA